MVIVYTQFVNIDFFHIERVLPYKHLNLQTI